jgi:hypothetical protein
MGSICKKAALPKKKTEQNKKQPSLPTHALGITKKVWQATPE